MTPEELIGRGTPAEQRKFSVLSSHYYRSRSDLDKRRTDFDKKDKLFRSYIDETTWPYRAVVSDPSTFTFLTEKTSRLISNKLRGRVTPRKDTTWLQAKIANELTDYYWDVATRGGSMVKKMSLLDQNTRRLGAGFGVCLWRYELDDDGKVCYDNPEFKVWPNRDVLVNPDHADIRDWIQLRDYVTLDELKNTNDLARAKPVYKNLDILQQSLEEGQGSSDRRDVNYQSPNKTIKGLTDTLGEDRYTRYLEIITEYTKDRIVTFAPRHGVILRDLKNPWGEIPVKMLKYYPIDDDIYGLSEIEPIEKLQRVENALISQYLDTVNTDLYPPLLVKSTGVQIHTLEFGPNKKWIMDDVTNVQRFQTNAATTSQFATTISFIISRMSNAMGETSQAVSNIDPLSPKKTATEIKDSAIQRLARDNYNQIFLAEFLKELMLLWLKMASVMLDENEILRITGKEALSYFQEQMTTPATDELGQPYQDPYGLNEINQQAPIYPVVTGTGKNKQMEPKFQMEMGADSGKLIVEPKDLAGLFDYIPDVESMSLNQNDSFDKKMELLQMVTTNPLVLQLLGNEGVRPKVHDLIVEGLEDSGFKDAKRFFESAQSPSVLGGLGAQTPGLPGQPTAPGAGGAGFNQGVLPPGSPQNAGVAPSIAPGY